MARKPLHNPPPETPGLRARKIALLLLAGGGAGFLLAVPLFASANFISDLLGRAVSAAGPSTATPNSQTLTVLTAALNLDPNPNLPPNTVTIVNGDALRAIDNPLSPGDMETRPANGQISVYTVKEGDTLQSIAALFGVPVSTILGANDIHSGVVHAGDVLIILPITGIQHTVLRGESLQSLAAKYKSDVHGIALYNNLEDDAQLLAGDTIIIPNAEVPTISTSTPTKAKPVITKKKKVKKFVPAKLRGAGGPEYDNYYDWPVGGGVITQRLHGYNGIDIGAPLGADIYASAAGTVLVARNNSGWNGGYGNYIVIAHENGTQTLYAHASKVLVSPGDIVEQGQRIGKVGRTGEATGYHLHFEIRGAANPFGALPVGQGE